MPIVTVLLVIVLAGVVLWAINQYVPLDGKVRSILNLVVVVLLVVWLLQVFGLIDPILNVRICESSVDCRSARSAFLPGTDPRPGKEQAASKVRVTRSCHRACRRARVSLRGASFHSDRLGAHFVGTRPERRTAPG
jgi:hypothetical protein